MRTLSSRSNYPAKMSNSAVNHSCFSLSGLFVYFILLFIDQLPLLSKKNKEQIGSRCCSSIMGKNSSNLDIFFEKKLPTSLILPLAMRFPYYMQVAMASKDVIAALVSGSRGPDEVEDLYPEFEQISQEDAAWVDSCLVADPEGELYDDSWDALREALLDTFVACAACNTSEQSSSADTSGYNAPEQSYSVHATPYELKEQSYSSSAAVLDEIEEENIEDAEHRLIVGIEDCILSDAAVLGGHDFSAAEGEFVGSQEDVTESAENIFRVWDLKMREMPEENDELIGQLKRAVEEGLGRTMKPPSDEPSTALDKRTMDELIKDMGDLSLKPLSD